MKKYYTNKKLNYNHTNKQLKYIILTIFTLLFIILAYCYFNNKNNQENFSNNSNNKKNGLIDVLLGSNRNTLTDNTDDTNLNIIYSSYKTSDSYGDNSIFFFRYFPSDYKSKIIGDLVDVYNVNDNTQIKDIKGNVMDKDNIPQLLNPIINEMENAIELTKQDVKDRIIINNSQNSQSSTKLLKMINYDENKYNFNKIYDFFNGHKNDNKYNQLSSSNKLNNEKYITYYNNERSNLLGIIKTIKYNNILKYYIANNKNEINIDKNILTVIKNTIDIIKNNAATNDALNNQLYVPAGYSFDLNGIKISTDFYDIDGEILDEYNKEEYLTNLLKKTQKQSINIDNKLKDSTIIFIDIIFLENTKYEIKIRNYPILVLNIENKEIYSNSITIQPTYVTTLFARYKTNIDKIKKNYIIYLNEIKTLSNDNILDISLELIRFNNDAKNDEHIIFGDIITTNINKDDDKLYSNYVKIPKRCCKLYKDGLTYADLQPIYSLTSLNDDNIEVYQHPLYKTFKIFKSSEDKNVNIYEIIPCSKKMTTYHNKITKYQKFKKKCSDLHELNKKVSIKDNSFDKLQIQTKIQDINENEKMINQLKKQTTLLQNDINKKNIINTAYNRNKLQNYNDQLYANIYKGYKNLNQKSVGLNIKYTDKSIKFLIEKCKNEEIPYCKEIIGKDFDYKLDNPENTRKNKDYMLELLTNLLKSKISPIDKQKQLKYIMHTCSV